MQIVTKRELGYLTNVRQDRLKIKKVYKRQKRTLYINKMFNRARRYKNLKFYVPNNKPQNI